MSPTYQQWLQSRLDQYRQKQLIRNLKTLGSAQGTEVSVGSRVLLNFASNDYLSLANHPEVVAACADTVQHYGVGSGASHLICGHHEAHEQLSQLIARWTGRESALLFSSGYIANLALLNTLMTKDDLIVHDKLNHASLIDGALSSSATQKRFLHKDIESLRRQLVGSFRYKWLVTDGVFSMDGDIAPLPDYLVMAEQEKPLIMVDDAHGFGVLGSTGAGTLEHYGLSSQEVPILMGTLGKAIGTSGAFVAGDKILIDNLTQFARQFIYTTAMPPAIAQASVTAITMIRDDAALRHQLHSNIQFFRHCAEALEIPLMNSSTAIQLVLVNDDRRCVEIAERLRAHGFWVGAIRPPTVPEGSARLRITINRNHNEQQIQALLGELKKQLLELSPELLTTNVSSPEF